MRLVNHPNVVDLKAFFYTSGEKVCHIFGIIQGRGMDCGLF